MLDLAPQTADSTSPWHRLADQVLAGHQVTTDEALSIIRASDDELLDIVGDGLPVAAALVRQDRAALLSDERQERALPRGLHVLFAVESLGGRDSAL